MTKVSIPFGEFKPDAGVFDPTILATCTNLYPSVNGYLPIPSLSAISTGLLSSLEDGGNDTFVKVMLHFNGADGGTTITDDNFGGSAHTWTAAGNANTDDAQFKFGPTSLSCDGTGDWVSAAAHADFNLVAADFTVDMWVRPAVDGTALLIAGQGNSSATAATTPWFVQKTSGNKIQFAVSNGSAFTTLTSTTSVVAGAWFHVECVRTGNTINLHINGTLEATSAFSGTLPSSSNNIAVGTIGEVTAGPWNGWIDEFRLSAGTARHTATFTAPTVPYFLSGAIRGLWYGRTASGTITYFAGTRTKLFRWTGTAWNDISRITGGSYACAVTDFWSFEQSGTKIVAVNISDAPQVYDIDAGGQFSALGGSPPQAAHVKQIGDFLVLSQLSSNKRKIQWSAINDITGWTIGTNLSDSQEFPDGGIVRGVAGGEVGFVLQENAIRTMQFLPGDTDRIFSFTRIEHEKGCSAKMGFAFSRGQLFFVAHDGFYVMGANGLQAIGANKVSQAYRAAISLVGGGDQTLCMVPTDKPHVIFPYIGTLSGTTYTRAYIYDWTLDRWSEWDESADMWASLGDDEIGGVNSSGQMCLLNGSKLAATISTTDQEFSPGMRSLVTGVRPITDAGSSALVRLGYRERNFDNLAETSDNSTYETTGWLSFLNSARRHRVKVTIPAATSWSHAWGAEVEVQSDGQA